MMLKFSVWLMTGIAGVLFMIVTFLTTTLAVYAVLNLLAQLDKLMGG